jgi:hypothetical protein
MAAAYPARVVGNSRSPITAPVMEIAATWKVSAWVSAPATMSVDSVKMVVVPSDLMAGGAHTGQGGQTRH